MKIKLQQAEAVFQSLLSLSQMNINVLPAWAIKGHLKVLKETLEKVVEQRNELVKKHADAEDEKGNPMVTQGGENWEAFISETKEMMSIELDHEIKPINIEELGVDRISPAVLAELDGILVMGE